MIRRLALAFALLAAAAPSGWAQEKVAISGDASGGKARLTFDWPTPATFSTEIFDGELIVRFARPFEGSFDQAVQALSPYIASGYLRPDLRTAVFQLRRERSFKTSQFGGRVVIDLVEPGAAGAAPVSAAAGHKTQPQAKPAQQQQAQAPEKAQPELKPQAKPEPKAQAKAEGPVARVRLGEAPADGTRLEIDWDKPVKVKASENGRNVTFGFETPGRLELGDLKDRALKLVEGIDTAADKSGPSLSLTLADKAQLRRSQDGNRFVLDILPAAKTAQAPAQKPASPPESKTLPAEAAKAEPAKAEVAKAEPAKDSKPAEPAKQAEAAKPGAPTPLSPEAPKAEASKPAEPAKAEAAPSVPPSQASLSVGAVPAGNKLTLKFPWNQTPAAAAFRRGDQLWIVFDGQTKLDLARVQKASGPFLSNPVQLAQDDMTVLKMTSPVSTNPTLSRDGAGWQVELRYQPLQPDLPIAVEPKRGADGKTVLELAVEQPGRVGKLRDPEIGDRLIVVPVMTPAQGVAGTREFAEFRLLASEQGVAVEPIADNIDAISAPGLVTIRGPGGLLLSQAPAPEDGKVAATAAAQPPVPAGPKIPADQQLFDFPAWSRADKGDFNAQRREMNLKLAKAPPEARNAARIENARFYFANLRPQDALGALELMESDGVPEASEPEFRALKGATLLMARRPADAQATLADPRLDNNIEAKLWRAMATAQRGDLEQALPQFLAAGQGAPQSYPLPLRQEFGLKTIEAALAGKNVKLAASTADGLSAIVKDGPLKGELDYLRANVLNAQGKWSDAMKLWHEVATRRELPSWPRAELALIEQGLATKTLRPSNAIERLEKLRYVWRGDALERRVIEMLAQLNIEVGESQSGLALYRELATLFPESPEARNATQAMTKAFERLFVAGEADRLPPLKALALYDGFRELTPSGQKGDEVIRKLADRVAAIDLLDRASELLDELVRKRLQGEPKAEAGSRLATLRLQNNQPDKALAALDASAMEALPDQLKRDRDRVRAGALFALDKPAEALATIAQDDSDQADRLRHDIYWKQSDWPNAIKIAMRRAERLMPDKGAPGDEAAGAVMNAAVAASLANDQKTLAALRDRFGPAMDLSSQKSAFRLIANGGGTPSDLQGIQQALEAVTNFQKSLNATKPGAGTSDAKPAAPTAKQPPKTN